jgi:2-polyprenyl-3-methyl-5-hydroxy-6-metoxy-1,4-benzoquinol methylase
MNSESHNVPTASEQASYWDAWNAKCREAELPPRVQRQAEVVVGWLKRIRRENLRILDVGCGTGWLCALLLPFGAITGIDFTSEVLDRARSRMPKVRFITGDFLQTDLKEEFDVVVAMEVISHFADQPAFLHKCCESLRPGGYLMLATQNKYVYERRAETQPPSPLQVRKWLTARTMRQMIETEFEILEVTSVCPDGYQGLLRFVNSIRLNKLVAHVVPQSRLDEWKERKLLGMTLLALARKAPAGTGSPRHNA